MTGFDRSILVLLHNDDVSLQKGKFEIFLNIMALPDCMPPVRRSFMGDNRKDFVWLQSPPGSVSELLIKSATLPDGTDYFHDVEYRLPNSIYRDANRAIGMARNDWVSAILIPTSSVSDGVANGFLTIKREGDIVAQIQQHVYDWIPNYHPLRQDDMSYGDANSTIESLEIGVGDCRPRASFGAAIAYANDLEFRLAGSYNLALRKQITSTKYRELWEEHSRYSEAVAVDIADDSDRPIFRTFKHWWLEVKIDGEWTPVDNMPENPLTLGWFQQGVRNKMICSVISLDKLIPENGRTKTPGGIRLSLPNGFFQIPEGAYLNS